VRQIVWCGRMTTVALQIGTTIHGINSSTESSKYEIARLDQWIMSNVRSYGLVTRANKGSDNPRFVRAFTKA
jgi:hypothetical protein